MHSTHKSASGFTLIELLIVIAIIGILAAIAIPQFNQYKIRGYDTAAKQGLRDVTLLCNAYWIDNDCSEPCSLPKIKDAAYGFNQDSDLDVNLPSTASQCSNFCASAKSNSSPNTYSIDGKALISSGGTCGGAGGSVQPVSTTGQTFATYNQTTAADDCAMNSVNPSREGGTFVLVESKGAVNSGDLNAFTGTCDAFREGLKICEGNPGRGHQLGIRCDVTGSGPKYVFVGAPLGGLPPIPIDLQCDKAGHAPCAQMRYNFETGVWSNDQGEKYKDGVRVE